MGYEPRFYQSDAINIGVEFFKAKKRENGLLICPTASGKSLIIANIAGQLPGKVLILQPSKEILKQNFEKYISYGFRAGIYSASAGMKYIDHVTFATIGSIAKKHHLFKEFQHIIIDECHLVNPSEGMYFDLIKSFERIKVLGLTATPYRLSTSMEGAQLKFLNRTSPRIFNKVLYAIQNSVLFDAGYLAPLEYFSFNLIDRNKLKTNTKGTDFTDQSLKSLYREIGMSRKTIEYGNRLLAKKNNLLVFCSLVEEAQEVARGIPGAKVLHGETPDGIRDKMLIDFKAGRLKCIVNVGVLTTGFDFPALECVLIARSTMSLALYYQIIGRVMRPYKYADGSIKKGWVVDLGGNFKMFGRIETMKILRDDRGLYSVYNNGKQLTNVVFQKAA